MPAKSRAQLQDGEIDELLTAIDKYATSLGDDSGLLLFNEDAGNYLDRFRDIVRTWVDKYAKGE